MSRSAEVPIRWRLPTLAGAALALLAGLYTGLLLPGAAVPAPAVAVEPGTRPLMVFGFVGTLIALERAVALGTRWGLLALPSVYLATPIRCVFADQGFAGRLADWALRILARLIESCASRPGSAGSRCTPKGDCRADLGLANRSPPPGETPA